MLLYRGFLLVHATVRPSVALSLDCHNCFILLLFSILGLLFCTIQLLLFSLHLLFEYSYLLKYFPCDIQFFSPLFLFDALVRLLLLLLELLHCCCATANPVWSSICNKSTRSSNIVSVLFVWYLCCWPKRWPCFQTGKAFYPKTATDLGGPVSIGKISGWGAQRRRNVEVDVFADPPVQSRLGH